MNEFYVTVSLVQNYGFCTQRSVQSQWFNEKGCTLHPTIIYTSNMTDDDDHWSLAFTSDSHDHTAAAVTTFIRHIVNFIKARMPSLTRIHFWTDGAGNKLCTVRLTNASLTFLFTGSQYKNLKIFQNLALFKQDYGVDATHHFSATGYCCVSHLYIFENI